MSETQREVVMRLLKAYGKLGVENHELIYKRSITRAAAIIHELRDEGFDIETIDGKPVGDGRVALCTYVLHSEPRAVAGTPTPMKVRYRPVEPERPALRTPTEPLRLPCGCLRSADGRQWLERCQKHAA